MRMKIIRKTQLLCPKYIRISFTYAAIFPGARFSEAGTGYDALTTALSNFIRPNGKVYSYERNEEFLENAKRNVKKNGLDKWVEFKHWEVSGEFEEENIDFIMIDVGSPWELIDAAYKSLKGGCRLATICPTFEQLTKLLKPLITKETGSTLKFKPKILIEVAYEEIQKSPTYNSGYALRFPRLIRLRWDKKNPDTLKRLEHLYKIQKGKS